MVRLRMASGNLYKVKFTPRIIGTSMVVLSSIFVGLVPGFGKLAYEGGCDPLTVVTFRSLAMITIVFFGMLVVKRSFVISLRSLLYSLSIGVPYAATSYGFLGSVAYIPVSLAILIFFLHPLIIALVVKSFGSETVQTTQIVAAVVALAGLALVISVSLAKFNFAGVALATMGALSCAAMIVGVSITSRNTDSVLVTFYTVVSTTIILGGISIVRHDFVFPVTPSGWYGLIGVALCYSIGMVIFFAAMPILGPSRTAMISNLEPVVGIIFASGILGEKLSTIQLIGIAIVMSGVAGFECLGRSPHSAELIR